MNKQGYTYRIKEAGFLSQLLFILNSEKIEEKIFPQMITDQSFADLRKKISENLRETKRG